MLQQHERVIVGPGARKTAQQVGTSLPLLCLYLTLCLLLLLLLLQVEPRLAAGNAEIQGHIEHTLNPFREATSRPFLAAGEHPLV
jgi:hypothetical protein